MTNQSRRGSAKQSPSPEALIKLVQDLNQRNHELLDRIATLEKTLEDRQQASQVADGRLSASAHPLPQPGEGTVQNQVDYLLNQLEFAQQTVQRQEIHIQTLSEQLTASQERVSNLEQDNARLQNQESRHTYHLN
ncbi:MAG: hypothetical protein VKK04_05245, partial [Synechococcales bacterium]|nr:hypothetical protein [Synechococcales bacterium]